MTETKKSNSQIKAGKWAKDQDTKALNGKITRFKVTMEFEVEVNGGKVEPVSTSRAAADLSREVAGKLVKVLQKTTGRKSLGICQSGCGIDKSMYAVEGEDPFLPVTEENLKYKR